MPTFAIGDVQGCFNALQTLLKHIRFNENRDTLWFTGDLVNRGPHSLKTLRFIKNLGEHHRIVLGNHDLHLLALAHNAHTGWPDDTVNDILTAPDRDELIAWLIKQPLLIHDDLSSFTMVHAGLAPSWNLTTAKRLAREVEAVLQSESATEFFYHMYGNHPDHWSDTLQGFDRLRCITNYFTRLRFCHADGRMDLEKKGKMDSATKDLIPWFQVPNRSNAHLKIIFGHWAALGGITLCSNAYALDTGCVWGYQLTALRLEDEKRYSVACQKR
jgi:bis(5'-nucleosyl)-tetraphosphatase (symmetrical)